MKTLFIIISIFIILISSIIAAIFIDDTSSDWELGTLFNMNFSSTGKTSINSTGTNTTGYFASQIFDSTKITSLWENITLDIAYPYGEQFPIGIQNNTWGDSTKILLNVRCDNNSNYGENDSLIFDYTNQGNNGTVIGSLDYNTSNYILGNKSCEFDGTSTFINFTSLTGDIINFSFLGWIYLKDNSRDQQIITKGRSLTSIVFLFSFDTNNKALQFNSNSDGSWRTNSNTINQLNNWYHIGVVFNGTRPEFYINGSLVNINTVTTPSGDRTQNPSLSVIIGSTFNFQNKFNGSMDELLLFNRTISSTEVFNHFMRGENKLNLSARSCDDSACSGESYTIYGVNCTFQRKCNINLPRNRFFQYNLTYSKFTQSLNQIVINNVTIELSNNTSPNVTNQSITPIPLFVGNQSKGHFQYNDSDGDISGGNQTYWWVNKTLINEANNSEFLNGGNITLDANITFSVRTNDTFEWGNWFNSTTITVNESSLPELINCTLSSTSITNIAGNTINFSCNINDTYSNIINMSFNINGTLNKNVNITFSPSQFIQVNYTLFNAETLTLGDYSIANVTITDSHSNVLINSTNLQFSVVEVQQGGGTSGGGGGGGPQSIIIINQSNATISNCNQNGICEGFNGEDPFGCPTDCKINLDYFTCDDPTQRCIKDIFDVRNKAVRYITLGVLVAGLYLVIPPDSELGRIFKRRKKKSL